MEVRELLWFLKLAETDHVTDAAAQLNITQPTLSRAIARLERRLGVPLFDRKQNRLRLNKYGEVYRAHVIRAIAELDGAEERIATLIDPSSGTVAVGFLHSFGGWLIPTLLAAYKDVAPATSFELRGAAADVVIDELRNGRVDVAFVSPEPIADDLAWVPIGEEDLYLIVSRDHRLARRKTVRLDDVKDEDFVGLTPQYGLRQVTDRICADAGFTPHWVLVCTEVSTLRALVGSGLGVGVVPSAHGAPSESEATVLLKIRDQRATRPIGMVVDVTRAHAPAVRRFIDFARAKQDPQS